ncbi:MAG: hypothetical protein OEV43_10230 [Coriobacteriia bacterium]|nr:hypothetical protein [Coriobacteriia bacterium]
MKDRTKKRTRRTLIALLALVLLLPLFAAFEAHIVNVKAHIENALEVTPKEIDFGVVFPQESLDATFTVALSESFMYESQDRVKDVTYELHQKRKPKGRVEKLDVMFSFDLTGSMGSYLQGFKDEAEAICTALGGLGLDLQIGTMSHVDYPGTYTSYGYSDTYGVDNETWDDYAYKLDYALTSDCAAVISTIDAYTLEFGGDGPQDYARIMHEAWNDDGIGWRDDAEKIVIMFGDNVPHDDNLEEGISGGSWTTGGDPGRDEVMFTADDLDLQTELTNMAAAGIRLYSINPHFLPYWQHWTEMTDGMAVDPDDAGSVLEAIEELQIYYADLRPYIEKVKVEDDGDGDSEAGATLDKSTGDIMDEWAIDFYVPCIWGAVGQEYPADKQIAPREDDYGVDIWVQVTGFSYYPPPEPEP